MTLAIISGVGLGGTALIRHGRSRPNKAKVKELVSLTVDEVAWLGGRGGNETAAIGLSVMWMAPLACIIQS